jgi:predicted PurR-regulated permease PerM
VLDVLWKVVLYGNNWLWQWVLILFILLFLLLEGRMLSRRLVEVVGPSPEAQRQAVAALTDMAHQVRSFLVSRTLINIGLGVIVGAVYQALGLRQSWTWALLTMLFCYVPYLGPIIAGGPPLVDAFVTCPSLWYVFGLFVFYLAIITLEGYVAVPVVMGRSMELNATTVMLACLFWELVWGLPGLFMAMPLMAAIKAVCAHVPDLRPWANLMSTGGAEPPAPKKELVGIPVLIEDDRR